MTQPTLPFDIDWITESERDYAFRLLNDLVTLCRDRDHVPNAITIERIRLIILTDAMANRLEAGLAAQLDQPGQRISGAQINATTIARHRHARALDDFEAAYPEPAPEPAQPEPAKQENRPYGVSNDYRERVAEVMERMAPELEPFEDPVVTAYFMEKEWGRKFHYELPKEAYTDIIRKPQIGGPIDPITREPMILMQYRARQAKWDEIRRLKAEAKAREEAATEGQAQLDVQGCSQAQLGDKEDQVAEAEEDTSTEDGPDIARSQVALGNALVLEAALPPDPEGQAQLGVQVCSQVQLGNKEDREAEAKEATRARQEVQAKENTSPEDGPGVPRSHVAPGNALHGPAPRSWPSAPMPSLTGRPPASRPSPAPPPLILPLNWE